MLPLYEAATFIVVQKHVDCRKGRLKSANSSLFRGRLVVCSEAVTCHIGLFRGCHVSFWYVQRLSRVTLVCSEAVTRHIGMFRGCHMSHWYVQRLSRVTLVCSETSQFT